MDQLFVQKLLILEFLILSDILSERIELVIGHIRLGFIKCLFRKLHRAGMVHGDIVNIG